MFGVRSPEDIKNEILDRYGKQSSERQSKQSIPSNQETESVVQGTQPSDEEEVSGNRRVSKKGEVVDAESEEASQRIEDNSKPTSTEEPIAKKLAQEADAFVKAMGGKGVHIVNDVEELPGSEGKAYLAIKSGEKVMGWYNLDNNQVYIYTPNANDKQEVFETLLHEFVAHKGLRDIMGNRRFDNLCKNVWSMMDTNRRLQFGLYVKESLAIGSQRMLARINAMSEQDKKSYLDALSDNDCLAAADEFIAHFAEQGVSEEDRTIWQAIVDAIREWLRDVGFIVGISEREIAQLLNKSHNRLTRDMTIGEMAEAVMRSKLMHERMNSGVDMGFQVEEAEDVATLNKAGEQLNDNGVLFNIRSNPQVVAARDRQFKRSVRNGVLSQDEAQDIRDFAESITEIATAVANAKEDGVAQFPSFSMWNGLEVRMNAEGKPVVSVIKSNSEYPMNIDFAKDCVKRTALNNVMDVLADRAPWIFNRLTMDNLVVLNDIIKNHGLQVPCVGCFVESRRYRSADYARTVVDVWNRAVEAIQNGTEKDFLKNNQKISEKRIIEYLQENPQEAIVLSEADIVSPTRYGKLMIEHPEIPTLLQQTQGQNNVQLVVPEAIYFGEVLDKQDWSIDEAYSVGGVRMQSFSDFKPKLFFDYCQVLADLSAKRLPAHSYTKVNSFAELFGKTGMKINLSLYFEGRGVDENGEYAYSAESIDPDFAYELQDREGYTENVGTMAIGLSDEHIWKMLKDRKIRSISPYHKSGINPTVAVRLNAEQFTDYTNEQNTCTPATAREEGESWQDYYHRITARVNGKVPSVGKKVDNVGFNMYDSLLDTDNPAQTAKDYVAYCQANGMVPKYASFVYNEDGSFNEEYYKLLFDFSVTDRNGNYAPQKAVTWREGSMPENTAELLKTYLLEEEKTTQAVRAEIEPIVDEVMDALGEGTRFRFSKSAQEFDSIQKEAVEKKGIVMPGLNEAVVDVVSVPRHDFTGTGKDAIHKAEKWANENIVGEHVYHKGLEDEFTYLIDDDAIGKFLSKSSTTESDNLGVHLAVLKKLPEVIDNSIEAEIHPDYKKVNKNRSVENGVDKENLLVHRLYGAVDIDGKIYRAKTTIHEFKDKENKAYDYKITKVELIISGSSTSNALNSSTSISAAKILENVEKSYDKGKKLLDESKKTSYGSQKSENDIRFRLAYHGSPYNFDEFSLGHGKQGGSTRPSYVKPFGIYATDSKNRAYSYAYDRGEGRHLYEIEIPNDGLFDFEGVFSKEDKARILEYIQTERSELYNKAKRAIGVRESKGGYVISDYLRPIDMINLGYKGFVKYMHPAFTKEGDPKEYVIFNPADIKILKHSYTKSGESDWFDKNDLKIVGKTRFRISNENQRIFVSNAERAVESIKQDKATPQQWKSMIEKQGGLKAGEDKWLGLSDWLEEKANATIEMTNDETIAEYAKRVARAKTLTKQEILDFIDENKIQIEEVNYTQFGYGLIDEATRKLEAELKEIGWGAMVEKYPGFDELFEVHNGELLWSEERASVGEYEDFIIDEKIVDLDSQSNAINETREKYTTDGLERKREIALVVPTIESWNETDEIHFGDAGGGRAVAWVRFGETTDSDGNRVLVIDEIQSKRHQEGREKGYYVAASSKELLQRKDKAEKDYIDFLESMRDKYGDLRKPELYTHFSDEEVAEADRLNEAANQARSDWFASEKDAVPAAPFEKNWHELAMKRMLRYAAENGYDYVAWTKGEQQAERYDMSRVIQGLKAYKTYSGKYYVIPYNNGAIGEFVKEYTEKELADTFGKELAQQIIANAENATEENPYEIEGEELRIGGEGMKGFYDKMLPSFVSKYTKKWGAKVEDIELPKLEESAQTMHAVNVTPEMKKSVMEGQVMFSIKDKKKAPETESVQNEHQPSVVSSADGAKILKDLDIIIKEYDKNKRPNTFLGDLAKVLGAKQDGSNSQYATFEAMNGKVFTIRLSNHNAKVSTFDNHDESEGISIVITPQKNNGITNDGDAHVTEYYYDAIKLRRADSKPLVEILKSVKQSLYSGEYKDTTGLAEIQEVNGIRFRTTYHGSASDFAKFDHSFMGTGEGLQSFGWGTYVTEVEDIAKRYANVALKGERKFKYIGDKAVKKSIVEDAEGLIDNAGGFDEALQMYEGHRLPPHYPLAIAFDFIRSTSKSDWEGQRHMYEVEIPDANEAYYIDYKDRMSNQGEIFTMVDNALASDGWQRKEVDDKVVFSDGVNRIVLNPKQTGGDFYNELAFGLGSPQAASEYLNDVVGITGIQYDADYHNGGNEDGAKNYVIFNADDAQVVSNTRFSIRGNAWSGVPAYNPGETSVA